jgi:hypothetical protein
MKELESVVLKRDLPEEGLRAGDLGAVVHLYETADAYEVEFVRADGKTVALVTLTPADIRPMMGDEILHVRRLAS